MIRQRLPNEVCINKFINDYLCSHWFHLALIKDYIPAFKRCIYWVEWNYGEWTWTGIGEISIKTFVTSNEILNTWLEDLQYVGLRFVFTCINFKCINVILKKINIDDICSIKFLCCLTRTSAVAHSNALRHIASVSKGTRWGRVADLSQSYLGRLACEYQL